MSNKSAVQNNLKVETEEVDTRDKEILMLKQQLQSLSEKLNSLSSVKEEVQVKTEEIRPDSYVRIMNGLNQILNLPRGNGREPLSFSEFGEVKRVQFSQLIDILDKKEKFYRDGYFFILDENVKNHLGYADVQALSKSQLEMIVDETCSTDNALELYRAGTLRQKGIIVDMLIEKLRDNNSVNMNLVYAIERESRVKIVEKAEEAKAFMEMGVP